METLLLNDSDTFDKIKLIFKKNNIKINLKNSYHIEDISKDTTGILITKEFEPAYLKPFIEFSVNKDLKVLAVNRAIISLIKVLKNSNEKIERQFSGDNSTFISLGSRLAEIIGGAGTLRTNFENSYEIPIGKMPANYLPSSINLNNGCIEALESEASGNILGVVWPILSSEKMPSRFENILSWISD